MKKFAFGYYAGITTALMVLGFYQAVYVAPNDAMQGDISRIFYYHVPSAMVAFLFFAISLAGSIGYLSFRRNRPRWAQISDAWALSGAEVGIVFCTVVLITGPIWGRRAWGIWWTWDARLTTTLVLWLIYVSYLLLRRFAAGPQMQTLAAVLGIFGALDVPIVYMSNRLVAHPAPGSGLLRQAGLRHGPIHDACFSLEYIGLALLGNPDSAAALPRRAAASEDSGRGSPASARRLIPAKTCTRAFSVLVFTFEMDRYAIPPIYHPNDEDLSLGTPIRKLREMDGAPKILLTLELKTRKRILRRRWIKQRFSITNSALPPTLSPGSSNWAIWPGSACAGKRKSAMPPACLAADNLARTKRGELARRASTASAIRAASTACRTA